MRILLEGLQAGNRSGTGVYTEALARLLPLVADDIELGVLWPAGVQPPAGAPRIRFIACPTGLGRRLLAGQLATRIEARRGRYHVVHHTATVGSLMGGRNTVVTVHDLSFLRHPEWYRIERAAYLRWTVARGVRNAARIVADSQATAQDLQERLAVPEDRIDTIPLGVDETLAPAAPEERRRVRLAYGLPERFFLYLGTLEPRKNLRRLVQAYGRIADDCPWDLVLAGRYGWKADPVLQDVLASPHSARIHLPGFIADEDKAAVLSVAEAFVWPSLSEGFGLPPLEAMACGAPVLTSNTSCLPETVGDAALTVPPEDVEAIADAMKRLADDAALRDTLRQAGRERAAAFPWRRTAERTLETYRRVAEA